MSSSDKTERTEAARDKTVADTFPASDPPANSGITGAGAPAQSSQQDETEAQPTGYPTSDRHASETAHHDESDPHTSKPATKQDLGRQKA